jgi:NTE family protein
MPTDDALALPVSFDARYGAGHRRALVLGGGGIVFVAWLTAYLSELARRGVAVEEADRVVGTSAGSVLAAAVAHHRLSRFERFVGVLEGRPTVIRRLAPAGALTPSQQRASLLFAGARDAEPDTIRAIGTAALAAVTPSSDVLPAALLLLLQKWRWPTGDLVVSAADTYSGERLAVTKRAGVPLLRAVAASSSVPGLFAPQRLGDRRAMDGGVSGSGIHADLVAGAERALVFPIADSLAEAMYTIQPDATDQEVRALRASGTNVEVRWTRLPSTTNLMDPAEVPAALALGAEQGAEDADGLRDFWIG